MNLDTHTHTSPVQQALQDVETWSTEWGLIFNASKSQAIDITNMREVEALRLQMYGAPLAQVQEFRYLGVWIDASLSWERQIRETCETCMIRLRVIR